MIFSFNWNTSCSKKGKQIALILFYLLIFFILPKINFKHYRWGMVCTDNFFCLHFFSFFFFISSFAVNIVFLKIKKSNIFQMKKGKKHDNRCKESEPAKHFIENKNIDSNVKPPWRLKKLTRKKKFETFFYCDYLRFAQLNVNIILTFYWLFIVLLLSIVFSIIIHFAGCKNLLLLYWGWLYKWIHLI